jgi:hypothetical protein
MDQRTKFCFAVILAVVGAMGCGDAQGEAGENIAGVQAAVGSTWPTPVPISNWTGLTTMDPSGNYYLTADIDALNKTWVPPGTFMGTLDGRGHSIKNLVINDTHGRAGAFFETSSGALIKNIRFTTIKVTGTNIAAGVVGVASDSSFDQVGVQGSISGAVEAGGIVGRLLGSSITRSYMKGSVIGAIGTLGGLVAYSAVSSITVSYAQATVTGNTTNASPSAGGVVGELSDDSDMHDVYAVGGVKGRGHVGGLIGYARCSPGYGIFMYNGISRGGDVVDANRSAWSGALGDYDSNCTGRWGVFFYDTTSDQSGTHNSSYVGNIGATASQLKTPTTPDGGVFCQFGGGHCMDNGFADPPWKAGTNSQNHTLRGVLDEGSQPL